MESANSDFQYGEMVLKAEYSHAIKSEHNVEEELQIEYEPNVKTEQHEDVNIEVALEQGMGESGNDSSNDANSKNKPKSYNEKIESNSSDDEIVANLARALRRKAKKEKKKNRKAKKAKKKFKKKHKKLKTNTFKKKPGRNRLLFRDKCKVIVDSFLSGPEGTLVPIQYKDIELVKSNQKGYLPPDGHLERFKKFLNDKELYCCEDCDYTSEHLKIFSVHFLAHANINFIQDCINTDASTYHCYLCESQCEDSEELALHIDAHRNKSMIKVASPVFKSTEFHWEVPMESKGFDEDNPYLDDDDDDDDFEDTKQHNPLPDEEDPYDFKSKDLLGDNKLLVKENDPMHEEGVNYIKKEIKVEVDDIVVKEELEDSDNEYEMPLINVVDKVNIKIKPEIKVESDSFGELRKAKKKNETKPLLRCGTCEYTTKYRSRLRDHQCKTSFVCLYCNEQCSKHPEFVKHLRSHKDVSIERVGKQYQCKVCCTLFDRRNTAKNHVHRLHCDKEKRLCGLYSCLEGVTMEYFCNECTRRFTSKYTLTDHIDRKHSVGNVYKCTICKLAFDSAYNMRLHRKQHSCLDCAFNSASLDEVFIHRQSHTTSEDKKPMLCCTLCKYQTMNTKYFEMHTLKHKEKKLYACSQCEFTSNQKGNLMIHEKSHIVPDLYSCTICDFQCHRIETFSKHKLCHGLDESTLMMVDPSKRDKRFHYCDKCEYKTKYPQYFKTHMLRHDNIRPYLCADCGASFSSIIVLNFHKKSHIERVKRNYKCSYCNYKHHLKATVTVHERKHTGEKPHVCDVCNFSTSYSGNLLMHKKKHLTNKCESVPKKIPNVLK